MTLPVTISRNYFLLDDRMKWIINRINSSSVRTFLRLLLQLFRSFDQAFVSPPVSSRFVDSIDFFPSVRDAPGVTPASQRTKGRRSTSVSTAERALLIFFSLPLYTQNLRGALNKHLTLLITRIAAAGFSASWKNNKSGGGMPPPLSRPLRRGRGADGVPLATERSGLRQPTHGPN